MRVVTLGVLCIITAILPCFTENAVLAQSNSKTAVISEGIARENIDLNGRWEFQLDTANIGSSQRWYADNFHYDNQINVPGSWQAQGFGKPSGNLRNDYRGVAWYRRTVIIPEKWKNKRIVLRIGGAHRRTQLYVNNKDMGLHDGFSAPFTYDITDQVITGEKTVLALRIDNSGTTIEDSPDNQKATQPTGMLNYVANWGGIYGNVELKSTNRTFIDNVSVTSEWKTKTVTFKVSVSTNSKTAKGFGLRINILGSKPFKSTLSSVSPGKLETTIKIQLPDAQFWSPEHPDLYQATLELLEGRTIIDSYYERFGLREIETSGKAILLNGKPIYLRGYGDDNIEVLTGFPSSSKAVHLERFRLAKDFGFNAVRFHSMIPVSECFEAADEVGMLIMAELPAAYVQYFFQHRQFQFQELQDALLAHRNHPSLFCLAFGNEFFPYWLKDDAERKDLQETVSTFYQEAKRLAPGILVMSNDGIDLRPSDIISVFHHAAEDRPTIRHEFGEYYCSLPDISLISQFNGVMTPEWLLVKKKWAESSGIYDKYPSYLKNSQQLQQSGRKFQIERVRADKDVTGYHYWLIVDYPGGTGEGDSWEEGWFDYFWKPKGITPEQGREINNPVLLMIDAGISNRSFWSDEQKKVEVKVSNYGQDAINDGILSWALFDGERQISGSNVTGINAPPGKISEIAGISLISDKSGHVKKLKLVLTLKSGSNIYKNQWDFWSYPKEVLSNSSMPVVSTLHWDMLYKKYPWFLRDKKLLTPSSLLITDELNQTALNHLNQGGNVWLMLRQSTNRHGIPFFPLLGGSIGTLIGKHKSIREFTDSEFCDLQFYNLTNGAYPVSLDGWSTGQIPIIGGIRSTTENMSKTKNLSHFAFAFEGRIGSGKLLVTTLHILENYDEAFPEAMTFFDILLKYSNSFKFQPGEEIPDEIIERFYSE